MHGLKTATNIKKRFYKSMKNYTQNDDQHKNCLFYLKHCN